MPPPANDNAWPVVSIGHVEPERAIGRVESLMSEPCATLRSISGPAWRSGLDLHKRIGLPELEAVLPGPIHESWAIDWRGAGARRHLHPQAWVAVWWLTGGPSLCFGWGQVDPRPGRVALFDSVEHWATTGANGLMITAHGNWSRYEK